MSTKYQQKMVILKINESCFMVLINFNYLSMIRSHCKQLSTIWAHERLILRMQTTQMNSQMRLLTKLFQTFGTLKWFWKLFLLLYLLFDHAWFYFVFIIFGICCGTVFFQAVDKKINVIHTRKVQFKNELYPLYL